MKSIEPVIVELRDQKVVLGDVARMYGAETKKQIRRSKEI